MYSHTRDLTLTTLFKCFKNLNVELILNFHFHYNNSKILVENGKEKTPLRCSMLATFPPTKHTKLKGGEAYLASSQRLWCTAC